MEVVRLTEEEFDVLIYGMMLCPKYKVNCSDAMSMHMCLYDKEMVYVFQSLNRDDTTSYWTTGNVNVPRVRRLLNWLMDET